MNWEDPSRVSAMPLKKGAKKSELPKLWLYRYGELGSRLPVRMKVLDDYLTVSVDDENYFVEDRHSLGMVWLRDMTDDTIVEGVKHAFVVFTPESEYMCVAGSAKDKEMWMTHLGAQIMAILARGQDQTNRDALKSVQDFILACNEREGSYDFVSREDYKGAKYTGGFADGAPKGNGALSWPNGDVYEGEFCNGNFHGVGSRCWADHPSHLTFNGEWENGAIEGYGEMKFRDGSVHRGWWHQGRPHGYGEMVKMEPKTLKKQSHYGAWVNGNRDGYGIEENEEKVTRFIGKWCNDTQEGPGILITAAGMKQGLFRRKELSLDVSDMPSGEQGVLIDAEEKWKPLFTSCVSGLDQILAQRRESAAQDRYKPTRHVSDANQDAKFKQYKQLRNAKSVSGRVENRPESDSVATSSSSPPFSPATLTQMHFDSKSRPVLPFLDVKQVIDSNKSLEDILQTTSHPFGMLLNKWSICFIASYSGELGRHKGLLPHAIDDINILVQTLHAVLSIYYPALSQLEASNAEEKINRVSDYFGCQNHIWLYRIVLPPIFPVLMELYQESVREMECEFTLVCERARQALGDEKQMATRLGFGDHFEKISNSGVLLKAADLLVKVEVPRTSTAKLIAISDVYKLVEKACHSLSGVQDLELSAAVTTAILYFLLIQSKDLGLASQLQFVQDFAGMALTFGDLGFAFKKMKDCYHHVLNNSKQFYS